MEHLRLWRAISFSGSETPGTMQNHISKQQWGIGNITKTTQEVEVLKVGCHRATPVRDSEKTWMTRSHLSDWQGETWDNAETQSKAVINLDDRKLRQWVVVKKL